MATRIAGLAKKTRANLQLWENAGGRPGASQFKTLFFSTFVFTFFHHCSGILIDDWHFRVRSNAGFLNFGLNFNTWNAFAACSLHPAALCHRHYRGDGFADGVFRAGGIAAEPP